jgi:hypothetical protein
MKPMKPNRKCATKFCRGRAYSNAKSPYCAKCRSRRFKDKFPLKYAFAHLRQRAKERGHPFLLSFEDYVEFARRTGYDKLKGKTKQSLSIHRIDNNGPYHKDNIAAVTLSMNSRLRFANLPDWLLAEMEEAEKGSAQPTV